LCLANISGRPASSSIIKLKYSVWLHCLISLGTLHFSIMKPKWCTCHSFYWESRASKCFENYLFILRSRCTNGTQYTKCRLCSASWWWASNARNMWRLLILNKLNEICITLCSLYWYTMTHGQQNIKDVTFISNKLYGEVSWSTDNILPANTAYEDGKDRVFRKAGT
jgi:hypothetical protein